MKVVCVLVISALVFQVLSNELLTKFTQSDYSIRNCRGDVHHLNKRLMHKFDIKTFKFNRTATAFNITLRSKVDTGNKIEVLTQVYKRASNEYRLFPIHFQVNYCKIFNQNIAGLKALKESGNMSLCEWKKGLTYHTYNFVIDDSKFPPLMLIGEYMAIVTLFFVEEELAIVNVYGEIYRPMKYIP